MSKFQKLCFENLSPNINTHDFGFFAKYDLPSFNTRGVLKKWTN